MANEALKVIQEWFAAQGWPVSGPLLYGPQNPDEGVDLISLANLLEIRGVLKPQPSN